jgi:DNA-binding CsgD family transcriptional regulator
VGSTPPLTASGLRPLVGRDSDLERLEGLLVKVRNGGSTAVVVRGEPGIGKSALLEHLIARASGFHVVRAVGVEGEVDLPYAGLHQLSRSMLDKIGVLPGPQRDALGVAFGVTPGEAPDRYIVGLAALSLMSEVAAINPLLCVVDDAQWIDTPTTQALAFVARRLGADSVGLLFASRERLDDLNGVPEVELAGLNPIDAQRLLESTLIGRLDEPVRDRILAETNGNPLAVLELPRALTAAEAATGVIRRSGGSLSSRIEESFRTQIEQLPDDTRRLLVLAAAEPLGDPFLVLDAASHLELSVDAADAAAEAGLFHIRERCSFRHPLVRSAVYASATERERRLAHAALADATDQSVDPDRKAWHRAQATAAPDEDVAAHLERTAARAKARGGLAAAGTFLERAAMLTPEAGKRVERALAAANAMFEAGAFDAVLNLLRAADTAQFDELQAARAHSLQALVVAMTARGERKEPVLQLLAAAERLKQLDPAAGRTVYLEALNQAFYEPDAEILQAVVDAIDTSPASASGEILEQILQGWALMLGRGFPAGTECLRKAMVSLRDKPELQEAELPLLCNADGVARGFWDLDSWETISRRGAEAARESGALLLLAQFLDSWAGVKVVLGDFSSATAAYAEAHALAEVTSGGAGEASWLNAYRCQESEALRRIDQAEREGKGKPHRAFLDYARALVYNGAGRYEPALEAAQRSCDRHATGAYTFALVELVEAGARCGQNERANLALEQLVMRTQLAGTEWSLGVEARATALLTDDPAAAEALYREAIERLEDAQTRPDLGRAHLVYGEWLRRESRRSAAREQLRTAYTMFTEMGIAGFGDRARRELAATGEKARKRTPDTSGQLTPQEAHIAGLAREGLSNPEIGARLFISPRTVEYHLHKIFTKLDITSRSQLHRVLPSAAREAQPA